MPTLVSQQPAGQHGAPGTVRNGRAPTSSAIPFPQPTLPTSRRVAQAGLEHGSPSHTCKHPESPWCQHAWPPKLSFLGSQPPAAEKVGELAMAGLEARLVPMGGGRGGHAKNGEPLQASRQARERGIREDGSQAGILPELQAAKGQQEKQPRPFQEVGMGDKPQVARDRHGAGRHPALPHPHPQL